MPFGMMSGVGRGMSAMEVVIVEGKGAVLGVNWGHAIVTRDVTKLVKICICQMRISTYKFIQM